MKLERVREAELLFREALASLRKLADDFPAVPNYRYVLAKIHVSLGDLHFKADRSEEAEANFRAALVINRKLVADCPSMVYYVLTLTSSLNGLAEQRIKCQDFVEARDLLE